MDSLCERWMFLMRAASVLHAAAEEQQAVIKLMLRWCMRPSSHRTRMRSSAHLLGGGSVCGLHLV